MPTCQDLQSLIGYFTLPIIILSGYHDILEISWYLFENRLVFLWSRWMTWVHILYVLRYANPNLALGQVMNNNNNN